MSTKERSTWRSPALGEHRTLDLPGGRMRVHDTGRGEPIVFVHGLLVNANLWRKVVEPLARDSGEERSRNAVPASTAPETLRRAPHLCLYWRAARDGSFP